jgi:NAD(P)-dependent dehydrogenase (short-subunit alcohol dehydrogenase family)
VDRTRLDGKAVVVTGAGGGIGRAICVELANAGASGILLVGRNEALLEESAAAARAAGADALAQVSDVSSAEDVRRYVAAAVRRFGTIDVLVNNAGVEGVVADIVDYPEDEYERVMAINAGGTFLGLKYVLPVMIERRAGSVINIGSIASRRGLPGTSAYNASKHAMLGLSRAAASEVARHGVRVNCLCVGVVDTRMLRSLANQFGPDDVEGTLRNIERFTPSLRMGTAEEVADVVRFLASDASTYVNGGNWEVDGAGLNTMGALWPQ